MLAHNGSAAWHMLQRDSTMFSTSSNVTAFGATEAVELSAPPDIAVVSVGGGAALSHTISAMPAVATPQVHHGLGRPA